MFIGDRVDCNSLIVVTCESFTKRIKVGTKVVVIVSKTILTVFTKGLANVVNEVMVLSFVTDEVTVEVEPI